MQANLAEIKPGVRVQIIEVIGGSGKNSRLLDMGITPGTEVTVIAVHPFKGPIVVQMPGSQIAIGRRIAHNITVQSMDI
ncbi:MAG: FeoA family protein [Methylocystaceae bacterium]